MAGYAVFGLSLCGADRGRRRDDGWLLPASDEIWLWVYVLTTIPAF